MRKIIVAFGRADDSQKIKSILMRRGYSVAAACTTGARVLAESDAEGGIVVCGFKLTDMNCVQLAEDLPPGFSILLIASPQRIEEADLPRGTVCLPLPLKVPDLLSTLEMMLSGPGRRRRGGGPGKKVRSDKERRDIEEAKALLMERNHMTEPEAHRYLQKCAMDSGNSLSDTAAMLIAMTGRLL